MVRAGYMIGNRQKDSRLIASEVLYMEIPDPPFRCGVCMMFLTDVEGCSIHALEAFHQMAGEEGVDPKNLVCGLFVPGKPMTAKEHGEPMASVTPKISGLGKGRTTCRNCQYGSGSNCEHPQLSGFEISDRGCCNAWVGQ